MRKKKIFGLISVFIVLLLVGCTLPSPALASRSLPADYDSTEMTPLALVPVTIVVVGGVSVILNLTLSQTSSLFSSVLSASNIPTPPMPFRPKSGRVEIQPISPKDMVVVNEAMNRIKRQQNAAEVLVELIKGNRARLRSMSCEVTCPSGYYWCGTKKERRGGFEYTWLEWARFPKETTNRQLIGIRRI